MFYKHNKENLWQLKHKLETYKIKQINLAGLQQTAHYTIDCYIFIWKYRKNNGLENTTVNK